MKKDIDALLIVFALLRQSNSFIVTEKIYESIGKNKGYTAETIIDAATPSRIMCVALCQETENCKVALFQVDASNNYTGQCLLKTGTTGDGDEPPDDANFYSYRIPGKSELKRVFKNIPSSYKVYKEEYYGFKNQEDYYMSGEAACSKDTAMLAPAFEADVNDFYQNDLIEFPPFSDYLSAWVGLSDRWIEGEWRFSDETLLKDKPDGVTWAPFEPNGGIGENCAYVIFNKKDKTYQYYDIACFSVKAFFLCRLVGMENVAKGKNTKQSSQYDETDSFKTESKYAVDGDYGPFIAAGSGKLAHTAQEDYPWWLVDLEKVYSVWGIKMTYNYAVGGAFLHNFEIRVGNEEENFKDNALCFFYEDVFPNYSTRLIACNSDVDGRFVSIQIVKDYGGSKGYNYLMLTEIDVYPFPEEDTATTTEKKGLLG